MHTPAELCQTEHLTQSTQADILDVAEATYAQLAFRDSRDIDTVHNAGLCRPASRLMVRYLGAKGHQATRISRSIPVPHYYVDLESEPAGELVHVDPTWQQFLYDGLDRSDMPKVLIGTTEEIVAAGRLYGVMDRFLNLYRPLDEVRGSVDYELLAGEEGDYPC